MISAPYSPNPRPPKDTRSIASGFVAPLLLLGLLLAIAYPLQAVAIIVGVVAATLLQRALKAFVIRTRDRVREFPLPGVGTVRFRITPR